MSIHNCKKMSKTQTIRNEPFDILTIAYPNPDKKDLTEYNIAMDFTRNEFNAINMVDLPTGLRHDQMSGYVTSHFMIKNGEGTFLNL